MEFGGDVEFYDDAENTPTLALPLFRRRGKELDSKGAKGHGTLAHSVA